jgi:predicted O-methyltransferase YrrM
MSEIAIPGQMSDGERRLLTTAILDAPKKPAVVLEAGTWLGGGSTLHILRALHQNGAGRLWGIEINRSIYTQMIANIQTALPEAVDRFTPILGRSQDVIPQWLAERGAANQIDFVFLDGGDNPLEQIIEFKLLADRIPVGGRLMAHDAKMRKGKWLVPYLSLLDNWQVQLHELSEVGLLDAVKLQDRPSPASLRAAERKLLRMRLVLMELVAAILPSWFCGIILKAMPVKFKQRLWRGTIQ